MPPKLQGGTREPDDLEGGGRPKSQCAAGSRPTVTSAVSKGTAGAGRLSVVSALYDTTNKGYLDAEEKKARQMDTNGTGLAPQQAVQLLRRQTFLERSITTLRRNLKLTLVVLVLVTVAMGGALAGLVVRGNDGVRRAVSEGVVTKISDGGDGTGTVTDEALLQDAKTGKVVTTHAEVSLSLSFRMY